MNNKSIATQTIDWAMNDEGLEGYMVRVYKHMALRLVLTGRVFFHQAR